MRDSSKIQTGINNISNEWFRAKIDRKKLKEYQEEMIMKVGSI